jgi:hypothetical protein
MGLYLLLSITGLLLLYIVLLRPMHLKWGATKEEASALYPGDTIVQTAHFNAVRGITINAPPALVWPWIVQIGSKKAGWYSIDWIDNAGAHSSEKIIPDFQEISIGQFIPFTPDQKHGMWVKDYEVNKYILWVDKENKATWLWYLHDYGQSTRLITKLRTQYNWKSLWVIYYLLYDVGDIVMMKKCMKGIRQRAENLLKSTVN